jgi:hypothetical protein
MLGHTRTELLISRGFDSMMMPHSVKEFCSNKDSDSYFIDFNFSSGFFLFDMMSSFILKESYFIDSGTPSMEQNSGGRYMSEPLLFTTKRGCLSCLIFNPYILEK